MEQLRTWGNLTSLRHFNARCWDPTNPSFNYLWVGIPGCHNHRLYGGQHHFSNLLTASGCSVANGVFPFLCRIHFIDGASSVDTTSCYSYLVTASLWSPYLKPPLYLPSLWRQSTVASQRNSIPSHPGTLSIPLHHLFSCSTSLHVANLRARERWKNQGRTANCLDPQARKFLGWTWSLA